MWKAIMKWFNELLDSMTTGSIPERKQCDCDDMECELKHLRNLELRGHDEA